MKKIAIKIAIGLVILIAIAIVVFVITLQPVDKDNDKNVVFKIESGSGVRDVVDDLYDANLIRSKISSYVYMLFNRNLSLKAGSYEIQKSMSTQAILKKIGKGEVLSDVNVMFIEGRRLTSFVKTISENFDYTEEEIKDVIFDKEYLATLINKYWFLTDEILQEDIYYPLEGYLFPATYIFKRDAKVSDILEKMLDAMEERVEPYKEEIESSNFTFHQVLTMASIVELEAVTETHRKKVSQVIYNRLDKNMNLGMDVTTYYAVQKEMTEELYKSDLNLVNPYNTRDLNMKNLPIGPICNPSLMSINAVLNPIEGAFLYFYADIKTGEVHFANTYDEFLNIIREVG